MEVSCQLHNLATLAPLSNEYEAKKLDGPQSQSGISREKKKSLAPGGNQTIIPQLSNPQPSHDTDWFIPDP